MIFVKKNYATAVLGTRILRKKRVNHDISQFATKEHKWFKMAYFATKERKCTKMTFLRRKKNINLRRMCKSDMIFVKTKFATQERKFTQYE